MNFSRQAELYDAENRADNVSVIGAGATGSWVAFMLSKLGVSKINIFDMDIIEAHNIPNQAYSMANTGAFKALICKDMCDTYGSTVSEITGSLQKIDKDNYKDLIKSEVVFCLVDSMAARKEIFESAVSAGVSRYFIETRMGLTGYRIYLIDLKNEKDIDKYRETLYTDEDAEVSACGSSQSIVTTAMQCASHAVGLWLALLNEAEYIPNEIIFDTHSSFIMSRKFDKGE